MLGMEPTCFYAGPLCGLHAFDADRATADVLCASVRYDAGLDNAITQSFSLVVVEMLAAPAQAWTPESMAARAHLSRNAFSWEFRNVVGHYEDLAKWIDLAGRCVGGLPGKVWGVAPSLASLGTATMWRPAPFGLVSRGGTTRGARLIGHCRHWRRLS